MTEEKNEPDPKEQPAPVKKPTVLPAKKNTLSAFNKNNNNNRFVSPKAGNASRKGSGFKGGGVKKGK